MAQRVSSSLENVTDLLTCVICMESFDDASRQPKLLPCHHTFCRGCMVQMSHGYNYIDCPTCRQRNRLPAPASDGVDSLQTNFYLTQMRDLIGDHSRLKIKGCRKHLNKGLDFFCCSCEVLVCEECTTVDHRETAGHEILDLEIAVLEQRQQLEIEMAETQQKVSSTQVHLKHFTNESWNLMAAKAKALEDIDAMFDLYVDAINKRRQQLKEDLDKLYEERRKVIDAKVEEMRKQSNSLTGLVEQCVDAIQSGQILDILAYKAKLASRNQAHQAESQCSVGNNYITFSTGDRKSKFLKSLRDVGQLKIAGALPSVVKIEEQPAIATLFSTLTIQATSCAGDPVANSSLDVETMDASGSYLPCSVQHHSSGSYTVRFRPMESGIHKVLVRFCGKAIPGGDLNLKVLSNNPVLTLGQKGNASMDMEYPRAVAVDSHNNIFVVDTGNNRIQKFDKRAKFLYQFPISDETESYSSCGIAVDSMQGTVICPEVCVKDADLTQATAILVYTKEGQLLHRYVYRDLLKRALSLAVNSKGDIIIADYELNTVLIFDKGGRLLRKFGEGGSSPGQFNHPTFVCIGRNDNIIVSDGENDRIQVFNEMGKFLYEFGSRGSGQGQFSMPFGVAADKHGNILVVDGGNRRIQIFKEGGQFTGCIESQADRMSAPRGVAVTSNGHVLVADRDNHCVKKYKYLQSATL